MSDAVLLEGPALHSGDHARVWIRRVDDARPVVLASGEREAAIGAWRAITSERSTAIEHQGARLRTVEHLFAALAGIGAQQGLRIEVEGAELPILDGTARRWLHALRALEAPSARASLHVVEEGSVNVGRSTYHFVPRDDVRVEVEVDLGDPRLDAHASWDGELRSFERIAEARTFCFAYEVEELARRGLASHVRPEMVLVIGPEILCSGRPWEPDEPARHKLLDLLGDLHLHGGPPRGGVRAHRPGHGATHQAIRRAFERGLLARAG